MPYHLFACRPCWYRLPAELRRPITSNYSRDVDAHFDAMADANDWYQTHPRGDE